ncbi:MAG: hypothetical protein ABI867_13065 [Kofleriaceae bacterium]
MRCFALIALAVSWVGCTRDAPPAVGRGEAGKERADCRSGSGSGSGSACDPGLLCLSNVCVKPPPADCTLIGNALASIDLGNYADLEDRAPVVAKYKAQCEQAYVTKEEGQCIVKARDQWSASQCAPKLFPQLAAGSGSGDCVKVRDKIRAAYNAQQVASFNSQPSTAKWFELTMQVVQQSCEQDGWPDAVKQCILAGTANNPNALQACNQTMPPALQQKLQDRMVAAMKQVTP